MRDVRKSKMDLMFTYTGMIVVCGHRLHTRLLHPAWVTAPKTRDLHTLLTNPEYSYAENVTVSLHLNLKKYISGSQVVHPGLVPQLLASKN